MHCRLLICLVSLFAAFSGVAQQKGLDLGVEYNSGIMSQKQIDNSTTPKFSHFSSYGANLCWYFSEHWGITAGAVSAQYRYDGMNDLTLMGVKSLSYLQIPVGIICRSTGSQPLHGYFNFGLTTYLLTKSEFITGSNSSEPYTEADLSKFNIGPFAGGGAYVNFAKRFRALVGLQFATGLLNIKHDPSTCSYMFENDHLSTITFHFGLQANLFSYSSRKPEVKTETE